MKKQLAILLSIFFFPFLLTGCWDRREINELTFVVLAGVDKEENGDIKLTIEIPTAATFTTPPLFWAHLRAVIFSEEAEGQEAQGQGNQQEPGQGQGPEQPKKDLLLEGTAVFKKDKLVGWLDRKESRGLLWVQSNIQNPLQVVKYPGTDGLIVEEIIRSRTKIDVQKTNEGMVFRVQVNQEGNLAEQTFPKDLTKLEKIQSVEKLLNKQIEEEIRAALEKLQGEYNSDIVGFGGSVAKKYP